MIRGPRIIRIGKHIAFYRAIAPKWQIILGSKRRLCWWGFKKGGFTWQRVPLRGD